MKEVMEEAMDFCGECGCLKKVHKIKLTKYGCPVHEIGIMLFLSSSTITLVVGFLAMLLK